MRKEVGEKLTIGGTRRRGVQREFGGVDVAGESVLMAVNLAEMTENVS